jgi:hypothetical protein
VAGGPARGPDDPAYDHTVEVRPPRSLAMVCGALGAFERDRVDAIARAFDAGLSPRHEEPDAIVYADRPLREWSAAGGSARGVSWGRALPPPEKVSSWEDAAAAGDCGLFSVEGRTTLHSSTPGVFPAYWIAVGDAVYFASLVDPLARAAGSTLSFDWDAFAGLLGCGCVLGDRTPFREIRRLAPQALLSVSEGRAVVEVREWPWLAIEPRHSVEAGAGAVLESLRAIVARLPDEPAPIALSGGLDSRILACLLAERGKLAVAVTVNGTSGNDGEQRAAAQVAALLGVEHESLESAPESYWAEADDRGLRTDYLRKVSPWLGPVHERIASFGAIALDGLAGDVTADRSQYMRREMIDPGHPRLPGPLWAALRVERGVPLNGPLGERLSESAREQVRACTRQLNGHPNRAVLGPYLTRMIGGVARVSLGSLGTRSMVEVPYATTEVAQNSLAVHAASKFDASLRRAVLELANPEAARIPTTKDRALGAQPVPQRRHDPEVLAGYRTLLREGPLASFLPPAAWHLLDGAKGGGGRRRRLWRTIDGVATHHLWLRRYGDLVTGTEASDYLT